MLAKEIYEHLETMFPNAHCELNYTNAYELLLAVSLSAQTTDARVNMCTPALFKKYPTPNDLANADQKEVEELIKSIGMYRQKSANIIALSKSLVDNFNSTVPSTMNELTTLQGVGRKTANVVLSEYFKVPSIAVDTHVERVSKRLKLAKPEDTVLEVETKLKRKFDKDKWSKLHHLLIFFGRYKCKAIKPDCTDCPFIDFCRNKPKA